MQCNGTGYSSPERGAEFGIISYDWSNDKLHWAAAQPMDCEERLTTQATATKQMNPNSKVFTYRNVVKALPWFSSVRKILDDPDYAGFFLKFGVGVDTKVDRCAAEDESKCSVFYHDQMQTPAVPTDDVPNPDGSCDPEFGCNVGDQPCGEYLFDHRNGTQLTDWLIENHITNVESGIGNPNIDGMFMDDFWCSNLLCEENPNSGLPCPCTDPVQGASEVDAYQQADMGLSDEDIKDLAIAWDENMEAIQKAILDKGGYTWSLIHGQSNANASPQLLSQDMCADLLRTACVVDSEWQVSSKLFGLTIVDNEPSQVEEDVAFFLLARGPYAWLGWGTWGMTWPFNAEPAHGELPPLPNGVPRPSLIDQDFGVPVDDAVCKEVETGVFQRGWSTGVISLDCNTFTASLPVVGGENFQKKIAFA